MKKLLIISFLFFIFSCGISQENNLQTKGEFFKGLHFYTTNQGIDEDPFFIPYSLIYYNPNTIHTHSFSKFPSELHGSNWGITINPSNEMIQDIKNFLNNPLIFQSSYTCGNNFYTIDYFYDSFIDDGSGDFILPFGFWNPFFIDINNYIVTDQKNNTTYAYPFHYKGFLIQLEELNMRNGIVYRNFSGTTDNPFKNKELIKCLKDNNLFDDTYNFLKETEEKFRKYRPNNQ